MKKKTAEICTLPFGTHKRQKTALSQTTKYNFFSVFFARPCDIGPRGGREAAIQQHGSMAVSQDGGEAGGPPGNDRADRGRREPGGTGHVVPGQAPGEGRHRGVPTPPGLEDKANKGGARQAERVLPAELVRMPFSGREPRPTCTISDEGGIIAVWGRD